MSTIETCRARLWQYRDLGRAALDQVDEQDLYWAPDTESNSIAIIVQHIAGNARSRFTDFLTTDGEKADRNRDSEFTDPNLTKEELITLWERGWKIIFAELDPLNDEDLPRTVTIRNEPHTVLDAILRQLAHYAYHIGQIVYLAKVRKGADWNTLSIPKGKSNDFLSAPPKLR